MARSDDAREALELARYFARQAEEIPADKPEFDYNLHAAIVFGRSVWDRLTTAYGRRTQDGNQPSGYKEWRANYKKNAPPIVQYFVSHRNYLLKERSLPGRKVHSIVIKAEVSTSPALETTIVRGDGSDSTHHPSASTHIGVVTVPRSGTSLEHSVDRYFAHDRLVRNRSNKKEVAKLEKLLQIPILKELLQRPALEVLRNYFDELDKIIANAESLFGK